MEQTSGWIKHVCMRQSGFSDRNRISVRNEMDIPCVSRIPKSWKMTFFLAAAEDGEAVETTTDCLIWTHILFSCSHLSECVLINVLEIHHIQYWWKEQSSREQMCRSIETEAYIQHTFIHIVRIHANHASFWMNLMMNDNYHMWLMGDSRQSNVS